MEVNQLTEQVIGAAIEVHRHMGPGLLESVYHFCMEVELRERGIPFLSYEKLPVTFKGTTAPQPLEMDFYFPGQLVLELKAVNEFHPILKRSFLPISG